MGSVVAEKLQAKGHKVLGLARNEAAAAKLSGKGIEVLHGDLKDVESLKRSARSPFFPRAKAEGELAASQHRLP